MAKGSSFERAICKRLSLWWTDGQRDDVLWRSTTSGARATQRAKRGQSLAGQYGDIAATDQSAHAVSSLATWELKCGYSTRTLYDVVDYRPNKAVQTWEQFINQAETAATLAGTLGWVIVSRRNHAAEMVAASSNIITALRRQGAFRDRPWPVCSMGLEVRSSDKKTTRRVEAAVMTLDCFLAGITPGQWEDAAAAHERLRGN